MSCCLSCGAGGTGAASEAGAAGKGWTLIEPRILAREMPQVARPVVAPAAAPPAISAPWWLWIVGALMAFSLLRQRA